MYADIDRRRAGAGGELPEPGDASQPHRDETARLERELDVERARRRPPQPPAVITTEAGLSGLSGGSVGESEALLQQGFEGSPIGMALTDLEDGRYLRVNEALCRLLGRPREELLQLTLADVTHPDDIAADQAARQEVVAGKLAHVQLEKRYVRPDASVLWASLHVVPVSSPDGRIQAFFSQVVDLTAAKEREAQLMREAADQERLAEIRAALAEGRFVLHAQPIVDLRDGRVVQQELLVRLRRDDGEILLPAEFLPAAERLGYVTEIDKWVTERAVELAADGAPVEVNLSGASVGDQELLSTLRNALGRSGADPGLIVFEVTETAVVANLERGRAFADAVRAIGCGFALDDFGTGFGTMTYLKHIPSDYLKIDIEFVRDLAKSSADQRLVRAIVTMAETLGKQTIAEGVENAPTLERLRELGVSHAQGFYLGRPAMVREAKPARGGRRGA